MMSLIKSPKAIIACVQGTASAAGCQLVSMCDLAVTQEQAKFCAPGVNIGTFCTTPLVGIGRNMHRKACDGNSLNRGYVQCGRCIAFWFG